MAFLECRDLRRDYGSFSLKLSLSMEEGEILSIIGPSGSGKSTLLSLISGIESPDSGKVFLDGKDITDLEIQRRGIGMVFQDFALFPNMNVEENIQYGMKDSDKAGSTKALLEMVGLSGYEKRRVHELSGGEAQRVALARAVAAQPRILLLDEPLSALDAPLRKRLRSTIRSIHESTKITMLYVTHDREEAFAISDRILVMKDGHIEALGTPEEIYRRPSSLFVASFTGEGSTIHDNGRVLFARPENIRVLESGHKPNEGELSFTGLSVQSAEYMGSHYCVRLNLGDDCVLAHSGTRPEAKTVDIAIAKENIMWF